MKFVCLFLVGIVFAQNLKRLSQVRWLLVVLVLSGFAAALYTGWQYTYGVGVRLVGVPAVIADVAVGLRTWTTSLCRSPDTGCTRLKN